MTVRLPAALGVLLFTLALAAPASAQDGIQHLEFSYGPVQVAPGQNTIELARNDQRPAVDGWIVGFRPNLVRRDGSVPRVDVIHLHHGVWLKDFQPLFAAGEEKTAHSAPPGYGWRYRTSDSWQMNHMIHNLTPTPEEVFITYEIDFIPDGAPAAQGIQEIETAWLDTVGGCVPGLRRQARQRRHRPPLHLPRRGAGRPADRRGRCPRTARSSAPAGTCTRAGSGPT